MRVAIATVHTPGIRGGAEFLADGLTEAVAAAGHSVHRLVMPFSYASLADAGHSMDIWRTQDFRPFDGGAIDRVIALKWPAYLLAHPNMTAWLLHQHRPAYDLFGKPQGFDAADPEAQVLRERIVAADTQALGAIPEVFTISRRVCERLAENNGIASTALYHPPDGAARFRSEPAERYLLVPSRLETLKRQWLLVEAMALVRGDVTAVIVGDGGERARLEAMVQERGIASRIRFLGAVSRDHLISLYARAGAVFFGPQDEDYGYVTLEAMLSGKPVITCTDSGGPLEFVRHSETGLVVAPQAQAVADAIDDLFADPQKAQRLGAAGRERYGAMDISWEATVARLLGQERP